MFHSILFPDNTNVYMNHSFWAYKKYKGTSRSSWKNALKIMSWCGFKYFYNSLKMFIIKYMGFKIVFAPE